MVAALVALLAALSLGTGILIFRHFQADATATSRLYSGVFGGLNNPRAGAEARHYSGWENRCARWDSRWW